MKKKSDEDIASLDELPRAIDVVSVPALLASQRLSVPDAALVASVFRRLRDKSEGKDESPIEESTALKTSDQPMSAPVRRGERFKQPHELMHAAQESAVAVELRRRPAQMATRWGDAPRRHLLFFLACPLWRGAGSAASSPRTCARPSNASAITRRCW